MPNCIFCKIANHQISKEFIYEDEEVMAFPDINPVNKVHILVLPKKHIPDFLDIEDGVLDKLKSAAHTIIKDEKLEGKGYRIGINGGGAQVIDHLHVHIIGPLGKAAKM